MIQLKKDSAIFFTYQDGKWSAIYEKDGNYKDAYKVELKMNQETCDMLFELDPFDEDQLKKYNEIVTSIPECTVTSMNELLPDENEALKFVGKTIKDLEDAGYERMGYMFNDDGCVFFADGPFYSLNVKTDEIITDETIDNYSENDIRELTITQIEITDSHLIYSTKGGDRILWKFVILVLSYLQVIVQKLFHKWKL